MKQAFYLGDGCYVKHDGHHVIIFTHNGIHSTNSVYMDENVFAALLNWDKERKQ